MPKPCSLELREQVVEAIASGASRREAAEWFAVRSEFGHQMDAAAAGNRKYTPKPSGGSISPLEAHAGPTGFDAG